MSDNTTILGSAVADTSGNYAVVTSVLSDGNHTLTASDTSATTGLASALSSGTSITVETVAPAAPYTNLSSGIGDPSSGNLISNAQPTIAGFTEPEANLTVTVYDTDGTRDRIRASRAPARRRS